MSQPLRLTLFGKIWQRHMAGTFSDGRAPIAIDRHVVQWTTSWHAFDALRDRGLAVRRPELTWSVTTALRRRRVGRPTAVRRPGI
jgi:3-isopropylmalate/(R)-2-methylmalate dehydratase large subunit